MEKLINKSQNVEFQASDFTPAEPVLETDPGNAAQEMILEKLTELENRLSAAEDEKETYRQMVEELTDIVEEQRAAGDESFEPAAEVLYDPYYSKNPYVIVGSIAPDKDFPEGRVVAWKNFRSRTERRGWRGWNMFKYGDELTGENGEHLSQYIVDPPPRMEGVAQLDSYVRRADLVLAWLDKRIFDARQRRRELESQRQSMQEGSAKTTVIRDGVEVVGPGLKTQARPKGGFRMNDPGDRAIVGKHHTVLPVTKD